MPVFSVFSSFRRKRSVMLCFVFSFLSVNYSIMSVMDWGQSIAININDLLIYPFIFLFAVTFSLTFYFQRKDMQRKAAVLTWAADLLFVIMLFAVVIAPLTAVN